MINKLRKKQILRQLLQNFSISQAFSRAAELLILENINMTRPILDLGCGDGTFADTLFNGKYGSIAAGVDILPEVAKIAQKSAVYRQVKVADAGKLPFADKSFATIISNSSLEHMANLEQVLSEVNRVLKRGGKFVFLVAHSRTEDFYIDKIILTKLGLSFLAKKTIKLRNQILNHRNLYSVTVWQKKLESKGFRVVKYFFAGGGRNFRVVEFFQPTAVLSAVTKRLFNRWVLPPRAPVIYLAEHFLSQYLTEKQGIMGPALVIVAQKI